MIKLLACIAKMSSHLIGSTTSLAVYGILRKLPGGNSNKGRILRCLGLFYWIIFYDMKSETLISNLFSAAIYLSGKKVMHGFLCNARFLKASLSERYVGVSGALESLSLCWLTYAGSNPLWIHSFALFSRIRQFTEDLFILFLQHFLANCGIFRRSNAFWRLIKIQISAMGLSNVPEKIRTPFPVILLHRQTAPIL